MPDLNSSFELYDENQNTQKLTQDEILMNEKNILQGLLELGNTKNNKDNYRIINIQRNGTLKLSFRVRPVSEDENQTCYKYATKFAPAKPGKPKIALDTNPAVYRSYLIYTATIDEDRAKVWNNQKALDALNLVSGVDMIDKVLLAGEKSRVIDVINDISGFDSDCENDAKN